MTTEKIKFKVHLTAEYWNKPPQVEILVNDKKYFDGNVEKTVNDSTPQVIEFTHELELEKTHKFSIILKNKTNQDTLVENHKIIKDQLVNIKYIEIDEIDIGSIVYEGKYYPTYPEPWATEQKTAGIELPTFIKNTTSLGHNGRWELEFSSPFYLWLLENLY